MEGQVVLVRGRSGRMIVGVLERIARKRGTNRRYARVLLPYGEGMMGGAETEKRWVPLKRVKRIGWSQ